MKRLHWSLSRLFLAIELYKTQVQCINLSIKFLTPDKLTSTVHNSVSAIQWFCYKARLLTRLKSTFLSVFQLVYHFSLETRT